MPEFFAKWDDSKTTESTIYRLDKAYQVNKRVRKSAIGGNLAMYTLGNGRVFLEALLREKKDMPVALEMFEALQHASLSSEDFFDQLLKLNSMRNMGMHTQTVARQIAQEQRELILRGNLLPAMMHVKNRLLGRFLKESIPDECIPQFPTVLDMLEKDFSSSATHTPDTPEQEHYRDIALSLISHSNLEYTHRSSQHSLNNQPLIDMIVQI